MAAILHVANVLTCAEAHVGTFPTCRIAAAAIQLLSRRSWQGSLGFLSQSCDQCLAAYLLLHDDITEQALVPTQKIFGAESTMLVGGSLQFLCNTSKVY